MAEKNAETLVAEAQHRRVYKPEGYTECDQRSDTSFLVGVNYGRQLAEMEFARQTSTQSKEH